MPFIDLKPEKEEATEEMASNLRVNFKERHCKRFFDALLATPPPAKKDLLKAPCEEQAPTPLRGRCPLCNCPALLIVVRPPSDDTCPTKDGVLAIASGGKVKKKDVPSISSSWDKIAALLKAIPCFTTPELPASDVEEFFLFSQRHFVNLGGIPRMAGVV